MKKAIATLAVAAVLFTTLVPGCSSIISGTKQAIEVSSTPTGAKVRMGPYDGTTPFMVTIPKGKDYLIEVTRDSQRRVVSLERRFDPIGFINILFLPGFIVDAVTGAMLEYDPAIYHVDFEAG